MDNEWVVEEESEGDLEDVGSVSSPHFNLDPQALQGRVSSPATDRHQVRGGGYLCADETSHATRTGKKYSC